MTPERTSTFPPMEKKSNKMGLKRGDVILVPFPFTDLSSTKVRPAVIVSADPQEDDVIIAFISSVLPKTISLSDLVLLTNDPDFGQTGLKKDSVFKLDPPAFTGG